jgi:hypothetical protein
MSPHVGDNGISDSTKLSLPENPVVRSRRTNA